MNIWRNISTVLNDPPPTLAFELSEAGIAFARLTKPLHMDFRPLPGGVISVSLLKDNILDSDQLLAAIRELAPQNGSRKRRDVTLILPDHSVRVSVLDFDSFPGDPKEQLSLVRFRVKKTLPYDVDQAALSYFPQPAREGGKKMDVVVAVAPLEIISRYEAPFRAAGMNPGLVTTSSLAAIDLVAGRALTVVAKLCGRVLSILVVENGGLRLVRTLELQQVSQEDIATDLIPTFVFIEDTMHRKPEKLLMCGFGSSLEDASRHFAEELGLETGPVRSNLWIPGEHNAGLLGYLQAAGRGGE